MSAAGAEPVVPSPVLHVYRNSVVEWFAAYSAEDAVLVAKGYLADVADFDEDEMDLDFTQEPDDKLLSVHNVDAGTREPKDETKTAAEWAREYGRGFMFSTEY